MNFIPYRPVNHGGSRLYGRPYCERLYISSSVYHLIHVGLVVEWLDLGPWSRWNRDGMRAIYARVWWLIGRWKFLGRIRAYIRIRCHRYCEYRFAYDVMRLATLDNCFILINLCGYDIDRIPRTMPPRVLLEGFIGVCVCKKGESKSRISKASNLGEYV